MSNEYPSGSRVLQKKPSESAFKQQKLPAWQPILTAGTVLPTFFVIGIAFIPIGVGILYFNSGVEEQVFDYTDCVADSENRFAPPVTCADKIGDFRNLTCTCTVPLKLNKSFEGDVFLYYGLTNFYQNHRRYVKSRDDLQLLGQLSQTPSSDCAPYITDPVTKKAIAPCGAIANSMFSDVLRLMSTNDGGEVPLLRTGIAWPSDKEIKFKNPVGKKTLKEAFEGYAKPKDWRKEVWELDPEDDTNNGFQNEDFIVWMRTAALPNFRKLYRRINHSVEKYKDGLPKGDYMLIVEYNYPVKPFKGTKSLIISTTSILGAKNPFLGYAYIVVGCLCLLVGVLFLVIHIKYGKGSTEVVNVTPTTSYQ